MGQTYMRGRCESRTRGDNGTRKPAERKGVNFVVNEHEQQRKAEVLKFGAVLKAAGVAKVSVSYHGEGDEGTAEAPQFGNVDGQPVDESSVAREIDVVMLGELLEGFTPEYYEDGEGGFGTITWNVETQKIVVERNWYETVSRAEEPYEI
jgi:hypothetical protein